MRPASPRRLSRRLCLFGDRKAPLASPAVHFVGAGQPPLRVREKPRAETSVTRGERRVRGAG